LVLNGSHSHCHSTPDFQLKPSVKRNMKDLLGLVFAVFVGIIAGTMPGVREKFPWGGPSEAEIKAQQAAVATPPPATPAHTGSWMHDAASRNNSLEKPAQR
jgi:hypothetical protein